MTDWWQIQFMNNIGIFFSDERLTNVSIGLE